MGSSNRMNVWGHTGSEGRYAFRGRSLRKDEQRPEGMEAGTAWGLRLGMRKEKVVEKREEW